MFLGFYFTESYRVSLPAQALTPMSQILRNSNMTPVNKISCVVADWPHLTFWPLTNNSAPVMP